VLDTEVCHRAAQARHVGGGLHEGQADEVGAAGGHREVGQILRGRGGQVEFAVGQVDALVVEQLVAALTHVGDRDVDRVLAGGDYHAADAAIVEADTLAIADLREHLGQGAADDRNARGRCAPRRLRGCGIARQSQPVAAPEQERGGLTRQVVQRSAGIALALSAMTQFAVRRQAGGLFAFEQHAARVAADYAQLAACAARVVESHRVALVQPRQPAGVDRDLCIRIGHRR
jgi:hypothetical protein